MIISVLAFTVMNTIVKYLVGYNVYQIVFFRSLGTLFFTIPLLLKLNISVLGKNKNLLLLRGVLGVLSLTCFFKSLNFLPLGTAVSLRYTAPIFAILFAAIFLKEKVKNVQWILFLLAFVGVLFIKNFGLEGNSIGLTLVFISAVCLGLIFVVIRKLGVSEHPLVIINYFMVLTCIFGGFMCVPYWVTPSLMDTLLFLSIGVFGYVGQLYMTKAFQQNKTSLVSSIKYLEVVFSLFVGFLFFQEAYSVLTLIGIALVLFSVVANVYLSRK